EPLPSSPESPREPSRASAVTDESAGSRGRPALVQVRPSVDDHTAASRAGEPGGLTSPKTYQRELLAMTPRAVVSPRAVLARPGASGSSTKAAASGERHTAAVASSVGPTRLPAMSHPDGPAAIA